MAALAAARHIKNEITEVLSYGPAYEIEFDEAKSGTLGTFDWAESSPLLSGVANVEGMALSRPH